MREGFLATGGGGQTSSKTHEAKSSPWAEVQCKEAKQNQDYLQVLLMNHEAI